MKVIKINNNKENINKIYHISDIHIRLDSSRYDEYRHVFENLYKKLDELIKNPLECLIVITGDILHSKTTLRPECIELVKDFFYNLANITDVIVIIGNHDCNMNNESSMNSLYPLIQKNFETKNKIKLLNSNRVYHYNNILFGVSTIYSKKVTRCLTKSDTKYKNHTKIALYHGFVAGAETDLGFSVRKEKGIFDIKDFSDYHLVLLGDVHKFQYLDDNNTSAYASSLIQQNYSESLNNHGMIEWDVNKLTSEFINIPNDYGFITLNLKNNKLTNYDKHKIPKNVRIKLIYDTQCKLVEIEKIENELRKDHNIIEFITNREIENNKLSINLDLENEKEVINLKSNNTVIDLIMKYIDKYYNYNNNIKKIIKEQINESLKNIQHDYDDNTKNISLESIKFNNTFTFGEDNNINFSNLHGIVGLVAPNHYGKSCIIDTIQQGIFGNFVRGSTNDILNVNKKEYDINTKIKVNENNYNILREGKVRKKKVSETVKLYDGEKLLTQDTKTETEEFIKKSICELNDLIRMNIILQNNEEFINMNDNKRKDLLFKYFNLDIFKKLQEEVNKNYNQYVYYLNNETRNLKKYENFDMEIIEKLNKEIKTNNDELNNLMDERNKINIESVKKINKNNVNIDKLIEMKKEKTDKLNIIKKNKKIQETKIRKITNKLSKYNNIEKEAEIFYTNIDKEITNKQNQIEKLLEEKQNIQNLDNTDNIDINYKKKIMNKLEKLYNECKSRNKRIKKILEEKENTNKNYNKYIELLKITNKFEEDKIKREKDSKELIKYYEDIKNHKYNKNCKECLENPITCRKIDLEKNIKDNNYKIDELNTKILENNDELKILKKDYELYNDYLKQEEINKNENMHIDTIKNRIEIMEKDLDILKEKEKRYFKIKETNDKIKENNKTINNKIDILREDILKLKKNKFKKYEEYKELLKDKENINELINDKTKREDIIKNNIKLIDNKIDYVKYKNLTDKIEYIKKINDEKTNKLFEARLIKETITQIEARRNDLIKKKEELGYLVEIIGKNGLTNTLFRDEILPKLKDHINDILTFISDFTIDIEYDKGSIKIYKTVYNKKITLTMMSGYEKFITNIAFRLAISDLNCNIKTNFFIIDEGFSYCDSEHIDKLKSLFEYLRKKYKWSLVVSHLEEIKENFDTSINIKMYKTGSKIF